MKIMIFPLWGKRGLSVKVHIAVDEAAMHTKCVCSCCSLHQKKLLLYHLSFYFPLSSEMSPAELHANTHMQKRCIFNPNFLVIMERIHAS